MNNAMIVGIHTDPDSGYRTDIERYEKILVHNRIQCKWLNANKDAFWHDVAQLNLFIYHWAGTSRQHQMAPTILPIVEHAMKIPCYPNTRTWWAYDDKIRVYYLLSQNALPTIQTWIFWEKVDAINFIEQAVYPVVFKLRRGASSINVALIRNKDQARKLANKMFGRGVISERLRGSSSTRRRDLGIYGLWYRNIADLSKILKRQQISPYEEIHKNYILLQRYLPNNDFDTRVTIIGERAFFSRRFARLKDFRASGSGNDDWSQNEVDPRCIKLAFRITKQLGFQCMSYDFLYDENREPLVSEFSYTSPEWTIWRCPGYWDESMNWHEGQLWPQYCILADALKRPDLKTPIMYPSSSH